MGQPRSTGKGDQDGTTVDTGSAVSVLPYKQYKEHFGHVKLAKSHVTLKTYTGQKITPKGEMKCIVKFKGQEKELTLLRHQGQHCLGVTGSPKFSLTGVKSKPLSLARRRKGSCSTKWISYCRSTSLYFLRA